MPVSVRVFICATVYDLTNERHSVIDAVRRLQMQHDCMEFFGARPNEPIETCLEEVRRSDVVVIIIGHAYGTLLPDGSMSFTEAEYREACRLGKPCFVYLRSENVPVLPNHVEQDPKKLPLLKLFKEQLRARHTVAPFADAADLAVQVAADLGSKIESLQYDAGIPVHLRLLRRGFETWNRWREENPDVRPELEAVDLSGCNLANYD